MVKNYQLSQFSIHMLWGIQTLQSRMESWPFVLLAWDELKKPDEDDDEEDDEPNDENHPEFVELDLDVWLLDMWLLVEDVVLLNIEVCEL